MDENAELATEEEVLAQYGTRDLKIARLREIERALNKMELEDENNDPTLLRAHVRLTRGVRMGCGALIGCLALLAWREGTIQGDFSTLKYVIGFLVLGAGVMVLRGLLYRPSIQGIHDAYAPHRTTAHYKGLIRQLDVLARSLSEDLRADEREE